MWTKFFLFLVLLSGSLKAADECSNVSDSDKNTIKVDLTNEMPPMRDQDSIGWCYGFVAADLWGHYLYKNPTTIKGLNKKAIDFTTKDYSVSALGVAAFYNNKRNPDYEKSLHGKTLNSLLNEKKKVVAEAGNVMQAVEVIKEKGFCFERDASSEDYSFVEDSRCVAKRQCNITEILNIIYDSSKEKVSCEELNNLGKIFTGLDLRTINTILTTSERENALRRLVEASCKRTLKAPLVIGKGGPSTVNYNIDAGHKVEDMIKSMDNHLERGIPVGILYYSDFLNGVDKKSSRHASSIVGKRFNPKTCEVEYLLRNSWGFGCGHYQKENPGYDKCFKTLKTNGTAQEYFNGIVACKKNNPPLPRNPRVVCDESSSYVSIRKSDIQKYAFASTAIEEDEAKF